MKELVEFVARTLVSRPDEVEVRDVEPGRRLELRVAEEDLGLMIGRRGRTAQALRSVLRASARRGASQELEILAHDASGAE
ncbi:MAG: KH domain-containing protein [Myxococcota bacterium]